MCLCRRRCSGLSDPASHRVPASCCASLRPATCPCGVSLRPRVPTRAPSLLLMLSDSVFCYPLPPRAISSCLFSPLFQRLRLFAAWLYRAKVSGHADKIRRWLLSELLFSSLKI